MEKGRGGMVELEPKKYNKKQKTTLHEKAKVKTRPKEEAKPEQDNVRQCTPRQTRRQDQLQSPATPRPPLALFHLEPIR